VTPGRKPSNWSTKARAELEGHERREGRSLRQTGVGVEEGGKRTLDSRRPKKPAALWGIAGGQPFFSKGRVVNFFKEREKIKAARGSRRESCPLSV